LQVTLQGRFYFERRLPAGRQGINFLYRRETPSPILPLTLY